MHCLDCNKSGTQTPAVGFCHYCGAAICPAHATVATIPIEIQTPIAKTVDLPKRGRMLLCPVCTEALVQTHPNWFGKRDLLYSGRAREPLRDHALVA